MCFSAHLISQIKNSNETQVISMWTGSIQGGEGTVAAG